MPVLSSTIRHAIVAFMQHYLTQLDGRRPDDSCTTQILGRNSCILRLVEALKDLVQPPKFK